MVKVEISLPEQLAEEARRAGLLNSERIAVWLREQIRARRAGDLLAAMERMAVESEPPVMSPEEVARELAAARAQHRGKLRQ